MTLHMLLWTIVAILAFAGLVWTLLPAARYVVNRAKPKGGDLGVVDQVFDGATGERSAAVIARREPARDIATPAEMLWWDQLPPKVGHLAPPERNPPPRKPEYRYRSAITGKFVKDSYAKRYPHRTVRSKVKS